jgi:hypothetical protein
MELSCKNRGQFGKRRGRPTKKMLEELNERRLFPMTTVGQFRKMASMDVREINRDDVIDFSELDLPEEGSLWDFLVALITQSGNPFAFKDGDYLYKLGDFSYMREPVN